MIPPTGSSGPDATVLLVGNSRALWQPFLAACRGDASLLHHPHPLETYIERSLLNVLSSHMPPSASYRVFWSHSVAELEGGAGFVAMQRLAACAGVAYLDTVSHLSLHPVYGPWFSLRCAVVLDDQTFPAAVLPPALLPNPLDAAAQARVRCAVAAATRACAAGEGSKPEMPDVRSSWQLWLAVRNAPQRDHAWRYSQDQVLYHYTGDREFLKKVVHDSMEHASGRE